jgi:hypothetical protein
VKQGQAVFLKFDPVFRGTISRIDDESFWVAWHRPSVDGVVVENKRDDRRMKVKYSKAETKGIGFGVPAA